MRVVLVDFLNRPGSIGPGSTAPPPVYPSATDMVRPYGLPDVPVQHRSANDSNSKIMLTAIISLSVVVVVVTLLHIYVRCVLRRQARRRAALRRLGLFTTAHVHSFEPPKTGLDPAVIVSLPIFIYKKTDGHDETETTECTVCLSMLEEGDMVRVLSNCKHEFHAECIDKWLTSHSTCPICRTDAEPRLVLEPCQPEAWAPPREGGNPALTTMEGTSSDGAAKVGSESSSRLSSFRRMLTRDRPSSQIQPCGEEDGIQDLERQ